MSTTARPRRGIRRSSSDWHEPLAFGTTETLTINTAFPSSTPRDITAGSYGEPLPGNTLKIVDPMTGAVLPRGERGEIAIKGPTLMLGYIGIPKDETFDAEGFFHTGDGGYLDEAAASSGRVASPTSSRPAAPMSRRARSTPCSRRIPASS